MRTQLVLLGLGSEVNYHNYTTIMTINRENVARYITKYLV